jgi:hypothetical protein
MWFAMFCSLERGVEEEAEEVEGEDVEEEGVEEARMVRFAAAMLIFWAVRLPVVLSEQTTKRPVTGGKGAPLESALFLCFQKRASCPTCSVL